MSYPAQRHSNNPRNGIRDKPKPLSNVAAEVSFLPHHQHPRGVYDKLELKRPDEYEDDFKEEDLEPALTKDVYSVLYTSEVCSPGFHFSILTYVVQLSLAVLLFLDLFDVGYNPYTTNGESNRMHLPAAVDDKVSVAQFLGLLLILAFMTLDGDTCAGLCQLAEGYEKDIQINSPNATRFKWLGTALMRITVGNMFIMLSFIVVMQAQEVMAMLLNLTGLLFLQKAPTLSFLLASAGVFGKDMQQDTRHIEDLKQVAPRDMKRRTMLARRLFSLFLFVGLITPYIVLSVKQNNGYFLCKKIYIEFNDDTNPQYGYYSGVFELRDTKFLSGNRTRRPTYHASKSELKLGWCRAEGAWTLSNKNDDDCQYIFKSSPSQSFDIFDVAAATWYMKASGSSVDIPNAWLKIFCNDCAKNSGRCKGICVDNTCLPNQDGSFHFGLNFEFSKPTCASLSSEGTSTTDSLSGNSETSVLFEDSRFQPLADAIPWFTATMYDRLVYVDTLQKGMQTNRFMIFTGRRWVIFGLSSGNDPVTFDRLAGFFSANDSTNSPLHVLNSLSSDAYFNDYLPLFFSTPVEFATHSYDADPSSVSWLKAKRDSNEPFLKYRADNLHPVDAMLIYKACNQTVISSESRVPDVPNMAADKVDQSLLTSMALAELEAIVGDSGKKTSP